LRDVGTVDLIFDAIRSLAEELCWLHPKLVAQVSFTEWTNYGLLRHATFHGLHEDKEPHEVVRET